MSDPAVNPGIDPGTCSRCFSPLEPGVLPGEGQALTQYERDALWRLFIDIGTARGIQPWQGLQRNDNWQKADAATDPQLTFWLNSDGHRSPAVTP